MGHAQSELSIVADPAPVSHARVPVARPQLPTADAALPYLRAIDASRTYSNFGPLNARFEARLAAHFGVDADCVVTCCSATSGLTLALQAAAARGGRYCLMPAWTFVATAHAAVAAGLTPYLLDVDPETGALGVETACSALAAIGRHEAAAVMPVAPFGAPLDPAPWDSFEQQTGVAVVIDAAAGFDGLSVGRTPAVVSLHATKLLGVGEGGFFISRDAAAVAVARSRSSFGFDGSREAQRSGANAKLSELAAAYGLAALDAWRDQRAAYQAVFDRYLAAFEGLRGLTLARGMGRTWIASTFNIAAPMAATHEIERRLEGSGVVTRRWWGAGLHRHPAFRDLPRTDLAVTERLAAETLGLPCWPGLPSQSIDAIATVVRGVLGR
ncbi:MAG TPA: aminotransferase class I/II-fold pyridoxal phosphate-dependent enzyme [Caulobacteraceae bacterium]|nr:aminotransferase class I/II-fold pyridoxal phosphate-dependent enzyme [Caulobacteraceae bacterium]